MSPESLYETHSFYDEVDAANKLRAEQHEGQQPQTGSPSTRYTLKNHTGATVRRFTTNDADFAQRVIARDMAVHGALDITSVPVVSPWGPQVA